MPILLAHPHLGAAAAALLDHTRNRPRLPADRVLNLGRLLEPRLLWNLSRGAGRDSARACAQLPVAESLDGKSADLDAGAASSLPV